MRLLLIRHGETVDNVAGIYAGTTDSALTTHGVLQASRLGAHLAATGTKVSYIFSSDLQRAFKTAEAVRKAQPDPPDFVTQLHVLREQDFGFYEGKQFFERPKGSERSGREAHREANSNTEGFRDVESKASMIARVETFLNEHLLPLLPFVADGETVSVVAHGIILTHLWRGILARFHSGNVSIAPGVIAGGSGMGLEYFGGWSNTGYLDLEIMPKVEFPDLQPADNKTFNSNRQVFDCATSSGESPAIVGVPVPGNTSPTVHLRELSERSSAHALPAKLPDLALEVKAVNSQEHLSGLKKTRGGIGSLKHDETQKTVDSFFKRQKLG